MKKKKLTMLSLLAGAVLLTSCSSNSCFNPCNWRPGWKNSGCKQSTCCNYQNSYDSDYDLNGGYYEDYSNGYEGANFDNSNFESAEFSGYQSGQFSGYRPVEQTYQEAPKANPNNAYSPYPNTSVEDVHLPHYIPEQSIDTKDVPYYDEKNIIKDSARPILAPPAKNNTTTKPANGSMQKETPVKQRNIPKEPEDLEETQSIQQKDLAKIKSAHQRVLERYKQRKATQDAVTFEDSEYFDQIIKKVISKDKKN